MEIPRTIVPNTKAPFEINHSDSLLFIGSCFSQNIGTLLYNRLYDVQINPTGIIYHPSNLLRQLDHLEDFQSYNTQAEVTKNEHFVNLDYHSTLHGSSPNDLRHKIQNALRGLQNSITHAKVIFISLGSAWGFHSVVTNALVSNCHKQASNLFERKISSHNDCTASIRRIVAKLQKLNPKIHIVFTLSPIRHIRYGVIANNLGKARLHSAIFDVMDDLDMVSYFPSFELLMDDLRDYRFYEEDMIHPSTLAINYIWSFFKECYLSEQSQQLAMNIARLQQQLDHKVQSKNASILSAYFESLKQKIDDFKFRNPTINCELLYQKINLIKGGQTSE